MIYLALSCGIVALIFAAIVFVSRTPWAQCLLWGHQEKLTIVGYDPQTCCAHCGKRLKP